MYCASSSQIDEVYFRVAERLGQLLAQNGITCITGAGKQGLMGALNDSVLRFGGRATGIIPQFMVDSGWCHNGLTDLLVTETMHERKACMANRADAAIALPGGMGTLEELAEILTWKQLGLFRNPVIILNVGGFYDPLLEMFDKMVDEKFMKPEYRNMWQVVSSPEEAVGMLQNLPVSDGLPSKY